MELDRFIRRYIKALPDNVTLIGDDKSTVSILKVKARTETDNPLELPVEEVHKRIVTAGKAHHPLEKTVTFINSYLRKNASDLRSELRSDFRDNLDLDLSSHLSDKMRGLNVTVTIHDSLTAVIMEGMNGSYKPDLAGSKHKISVVLQISEPDKTMYTATGTDLDMTKLNIPYLKNNCTRQLLTSSIEFKIKELKETIFEGEVTDMQALLALVVVLKCQAPSWRRFIWEAWLAVTIQWFLLEEDKEVFPCQWMKQMFYAESLVELKDVKCLLLGQDPVSRPNATTNLTKLREATGIAFHGIGNGNSSIKRMKDCYNIDCFDNNPIMLCKSGRLMVNMIRTIARDDKSVSMNTYRSAWIAYTLKLSYFLSKKGKPVIVFCKFPSALPAMYMPTACVDVNLTCTYHPTHVDPVEHERDIQEVAKILQDLND